MIVAQEDQDEDNAVASKRLACLIVERCYCA
jgi:hypothetical protein